jgi:hypothetical protein
MKLNKYALPLAAIALTVTAASAFYLAKGKRTSAPTIKVGNLSSIPTQAVPEVKPQDAGQGSQTDSTAETTKSFLGTLTPGGATESAGRERNYIVTYQVAFLRKAPSEKLPEENLTYQQLQAQAGALAPPVFYGQSVSGTYDPAHPESIAVRAKIYNKEVRGYIDAQKLWLEPAIATVDTPRYMCLKDRTAVHVVPDVGSPAVLSLLQGEVVEAVGQLDFQGGQWVKAQFNGNETPRYGFTQASKLQALTVATVNQSAVAAEEIPRKINYSNVSLADANRQKLSQMAFMSKAFRRLRKSAWTTWQTFTKRRASPLSPRTSFSMPTT